MAYLALGSNLGDRKKYLASARAGISGLPGTRIVAESSIEETDPIGPPGQNAYLNQMLIINTTFDPHSLLREPTQQQHELPKF